MSLAKILVAAAFALESLLATAMTSNANVASTHRALYEYLKSLRYEEKEDEQPKLDGWISYKGRHMRDPSDPIRAFRLPLYETDEEDGLVLDAQKHGHQVTKQMVFCSPAVKPYKSIPPDGVLPIFKHAGKVKVIGKQISKLCLYVPGTRALLDEALKAFEEKAVALPGPKGKQMLMLASTQQTPNKRKAASPQEVWEVIDTKRDPPKMPNTKAPQASPKTPNYIAQDGAQGGKKCPPAPRNRNRFGRGMEEVNKVTKKTTDPLRAIIQTWLSTEHFNFPESLTKQKGRGSFFTWEGKTLTREMFLKIYDFGEDNKIGPSDDYKPWKTLVTATGFLPNFPSKKQCPAAKTLKGRYDRLVVALKDAYNKEVQTADVESYSN